MALFCCLRCFIPRASNGFESSAVTETVNGIYQTYLCSDLHESSGKGLGKDMKACCKFKNQ